MLATSSCINKPNKARSNPIEQTSDHGLAIYAYHNKQVVYVRMSTRE